MPSFGEDPAATGAVEQTNSADQALAMGARKCSVGGASAGATSAGLACLAFDWAQELLATTGVEAVLMGSALCQVGAADGGADAGQEAFDPDHLFMSLLRERLLRDLLFLWDPQQPAFHCLVSLGWDVCGHPRIVHGGLISALVDETTGALVYKLKSEGRLEGACPGPAFTARLEVDYKRPVPASSHLVCTARVEKVEGRKIWTVAEVAARPGGTVYAVGRALYVTPRSASDKAAQQAQQQPVVS